MKRILVALSLFVCVLCTLPVHATLVGTTPGEFAVSPSGAATYTVPIELPPTVGGVKPSLALSYNSQAGNGIAGIGWGLSGLSSISRCPTTLEQDGFIDGVDFDGNDKLCLDGQRLVATPDGTYRTEIDSFSRISITGSTSNPTSFTVNTKSGEKMIYEADASGSSGTLSWRLKSTEDTLGNTAVFSYFTNATETYLTSITMGAVSVYLSHEFRTDKQYWYNAGIKRELNQRLKLIQIAVTGNTVRSYKLNYSQDIKSTLSSVQLCHGNNCSEPSTFTYSGKGARNLEAPTTWSNYFGYDNGWRTDLHQRVLSDVNGDGLPDVVGFSNGGTSVALNNGSGFQAPTTWSGEFGYNTGWRVDKHPRMLVDVNGDGLADVVGFSNGGVSVALSSGTTFGTPTTWSNYFGYDNGWRTDLHQRVLSDVNSDGLPDVVGFSNGGTSVALNNGSGFQAPTTWSGEFGYNTGWRVDKHPRMLVDVNGDGLADVVGFSNGGTSIALNNGTGFQVPTTWSGEFGYNTGWRVDKHPRMLVDVNGDGLPDVVGFSNRGISVSTSNSKENVKITKISSKLKAGIDIEYQPLRKSAYYSTVSRTAPVFEAQSSFSKVVTKIKVDSGKNEFNTISYKYEGSAYDVRRRSSLGFKKMTVTNTATNTETITEYRQDFPYIGAQKSSITTLHGKKISESSNNYAYKNTPWFVYPTTSSQKSWSYNSDGTTTLLSETLSTNNSFDAYGNPTSMTVVINDAGGTPINTTETTNTYDNTEHNWHLGRLRTATVTQMPLIGTRVTKESSFDYDLTTGLLKQEVIEPNNPLHKLVTDYEYDLYGNRTKVTVTGNHKNYDVNGVATLGAAFSRETNTEYAAGVDHPAGLFPTKITNAKGHFETRVYDPLYGNVIKTTGPNGIPTFFEYDALGRKVKTIPAVGKPSVTNYAWCAAGGNCPDANGYSITKTVADVTGSATVYFDRYGRSVRKASTDRNNALIYADTEYDSLGRVSRVSEPSYTAGDWSKFTQSHYDAAGRVNQVTRPDGLTAPATIFNGLTTTTYDVKGRATATTKNALGQTIRIEDPANGTVSYTYDAVGNLTKTSTCEAGNNCVDVDLEYDLRGNKVKMIDPDMGTWLYGYNTLGELAWQKDAKGQVTTMQYDVLGRMVKRNDADGAVSEWVYDTAAGKGVGKLHKVLLNGNVFKQLSYDGFGRPLSSTTTIDGSYTYTTTSGYDSAFGRLDSLTYPAGFKLQYNYKDTGHLQSVTKFGDSGTAYWTEGSVCDNRPGALCTQFLGIRSTAVDGFDGIQVSSTYDNVNPWLVSQMANKVGDIFNPYQAFTYDYDNVGNLLSREQAGYAIGGTSDAKIERFDYDTYLDRVTGATTDGVATGAYAYDGLGNITFKNDVGSYTYGAAASSCNADSFAGPHAVTQTTLNGVTTNYCYDANGNLLNGNGRTVTWNSFNKPLRMTQNGKWAEFSYGPNRSRYKKTSSDLATTHYVGMGGTGNVLYEKEFLNGSTTDYVARNHIYVGGKRIAVKLDYHNAQINDPEVVHYMLGDHLGSVTTIVNQDGNVVRRKSFDVWGKARNADTWSGTAALDTDNHRGYTGHEAIQEVGLVHMNGRVYDATLARFVSADPHIQSAGHSQSYNRYSYVMNNPLAHIDPSGYFFKKIKKAFKKLGRGIKKSWKKIRGVIKIVVGVAIVAFGGPFASLGIPFIDSGIKDLNGESNTTPNRVNISLPFPGTRRQEDERRLDSNPLNQLWSQPSNIVSRNSEVTLSNRAVKEMHGRLGITLTRPTPTINPVISGYDYTVPVIGGPVSNNREMNANSSALLVDVTNSPQRSRGCAGRPCRSRSTGGTSNAQSIQFGVGLTQVVIGAGICASGGGCLIGGGLIFNGIDDMKEVITGDPFLADATDLLFNDPQMGRDLDMAADIAAGGKGILTSPIKFAVKDPDALLYLVTSGSDFADGVRDSGL